MQGLRHAGLRLRCINRSSPLPVSSCVYENKRFFMNKTQLIDEVAAKADLSKRQAKDAVEATFAAITGSLAEEDQCVKNHCLGQLHCSSIVLFTELCSFKWIEETQTHTLWYANCDTSVPCSRRVLFLMQGTTHWIRYIIQGKIVRTRIPTNNSV